MTDPSPDEPQYEPPAIASLGRIDELTAGVIDNSANDGTTGPSPSDQLLKQDIARVDDPLAQLRLIRTRQPG